MTSTLRGGYPNAEGGCVDLVLWIWPECRQGEGGLKSRLCRRHLSMALKGASIEYIRTEGGGWKLLDFCTNSSDRLCDMRTKGEGVKNPEIFAGVLNGSCLIVSLYREQPKIHMAGIFGSVSGSEIQNYSIGRNAAAIMTMTGEWQNLRPPAPHFPML